MTKAERRIIWCASMVLPGFPYRWLKPHLKPIARRLRDDGYLRRRGFAEGMKPTARGLAALARTAQ